MLQWGQKQFEGQCEFIELAVLCEWHGIFSRALIFVQGRHAALLLGHERPVTLECLPAGAPGLEAWI